MRLEVVVLNPTPRRGTGADGNGGRGPLQVKQRVNVFGAGTNGPDTTLRQQGDLVQQDIPHQKMGIDLTPLVETIVAVHAAAQQHLKSTAERVLVDARGPVEPEIDVDVEPR